MPALALERVCVRFGGILALDDVALEVASGEIVGLIGPNGAGKTTLIDVISGNRLPKSGEVTFYGQPVTKAPPVRRARLGLSRTFQQLSLFDGMTVREHVLLGYLSRAAEDLPLRGFVNRRAQVQQLAFADDSSLSPAALLGRLGLEEVADELASAQAVGVVRMVDLARALASRPRLLLLDEPVSGLAEAEARSVAEVIQSIRHEHKMSMLIVEHDLEFARLVSDRMVALDFGKVIGTGDPDSVLSSDVVRSAYFGEDATTTPVIDDDRIAEELEPRAGADQQPRPGAAIPMSSGKAMRRAGADAPPARFEAQDVTVSYGDVVALNPLSLTIEPGTVLAVLGPNGAGKTSLANALSGLVASSCSSITLDGVEVGSMAPFKRARLGIGHLPDSRAIFPSLTVAENLRMGFHRQKTTMRQDIDAAYEQFPHLARRKTLAAGKLSGGEQQMLALARLMVAPPRLLIIDELSHGLAPGIVASLFDGLMNLKGSCSILVIEQFVSRAVELADTVLVLSHGDVKHVGPAAEFTTELAMEFYSLHAGEA